MNMMLVGVAVLVVLLLVYMYYPRASPQAPQMPRQVIGGNNGTASCQDFCAKNWHGELPAEWNGAKCVGSSQIGGDCNLPATSVNGGVLDNVQCTCEATGAGWVPK